MRRNYMSRLAILLFITTIFSQQQIELPMKFSGVRYSPAISKPQEILGHTVGTCLLYTSDAADE